jgi:hypothetical protein
MAVGAGRLRGDPLAGAVIQRGLAVEGGGDLHPHPRGLADHAAEKPEIEFARLRGPRGRVSTSTPGGAQALEALAGHQRVGIGDGERTTLAMPAGGEGVTAGAGAALVRAGSSVTQAVAPVDGVAQGGGVAERHDFGVGACRAAECSPGQERPALSVMTQPTLGLGRRVAGASCASPSANCIGPATSSTRPVSW